MAYFLDKLYEVYGNVFFHCKGKHFLLLIFSVLTLFYYCPNNYYNESVMFKYLVVKASFFFYLFLTNYIHVVFKRSMKV